MDLDMLVRLAEEHLAEGRLMSARATLVAARKAAPDDVRVAPLLATVEADLRRHGRPLDNDAAAIPVPTVEEAIRLAAAGRKTDAAAAYRAILANDPKNGPAAANLASLLHGSGDHDAAIMVCRTALAHHPDLAVLHYNLAVSLQQKGQMAAAIDAYGRAIALKPAWPEAFYNIGTAAQSARRFEDAADFYRQALALRPDYGSAWNNLGNVLRELADLNGSLDAFTTALRVDPGHDYARFNRALTHLTAGDLPAGFADYLTRFEAEKIRRLGGHRDYAAPWWRGEPLDGKTILLIGEQGVGDTFQFIRYAPILKAQGARVLLDCQKGLAELLARTPGLDAIYPKPEDGKLPEPIDYQVFLMDLPGLTGSTIDTIPADVPYIQPSDAARARWRGRIDGGGLKVGLVWFGNPKNIANAGRSPGLAPFGALAGLDGVRLYALQKGPGSDQLDDPPAGLEIEDLGPDLDSFDDTAAAIERLDLTLSICTSVTHLAGAMGAPLWVLLQKVPDWRWFLGRDDSPWYPSARLFRQTKRDAWGPVFQAVRRALAERAAGG
jgi:tetratricopeptide (TPR) repeat protein